MTPGLLAPIVFIYSHSYSIVVNDSPGENGSPGGQSILGEKLQLIFIIDL